MTLTWESCRAGRRRRKVRGELPREPGRRDHGEGLAQPLWVEKRGMGVRGAPSRLLSTVRGTNSGEHLFSTVFGAQGL